MDFWADFSILRKFPLRLLRDKGVGPIANWNSFSKFFSQTSSHLLVIKMDSKKVLNA